MISSSEQRRVPRLEHMDQPINVVLGGRFFLMSGKLRDLAVDSMRVEFTGPQRWDKYDEDEIEAHVPALNLYVRCRSRVARAYDANAREKRHGLALQLINLDPATRAMIRSLYSLEVAWPDAQS